MESLRYSLLVQPITDLLDSGQVTNLHPGLRLQLHIKGNIITTALSLDGTNYTFAVTFASPVVMDKIQPFYQTPRSDYFP